MPPYRKHIMHGTIWGPESARPAAAAANGGVYYNTTAGTWQISNGTSWSDLAAGGGPSPSATVTSETSYGATSSAGSASAYSRGDHTHGTPALGTTAATACAGNDSRLSDARAPTSHNNTAHSETYITQSAITTHEGAADPHTGYQKESEKGSASGYASLDSSTLVPVAQLGTGTPTGAKFLRDDRTWQTPAGGSTPAWHSVLYGACGGCDPNGLLRLMQHNPVNATPTNITTSLARGVYFRPPANITVNKIRAFGVGATTNIYRVALYATPAGGARLTAELVFSTSAQAWVAIGSSLGVALTAGTLYALLVSVNTTGTTAGLQCAGGTTGRIGVLPASWPGSLDIDAASPIIEPCAHFQCAVTTGALPATLPTIAARGAWTGGMPAFFLDSNNA